MNDTLIFTNIGSSGSETPTVYSYVKSLIFSMDFGTVNEQSTD